jgi:uncharacterized protein (DUF305 family)
VRHPLVHIESTLPILLAAALGASCATGAREPVETVESTAPAANPIEGGGSTDADVRFVQEMIHHHAQALEMTELVADRAESAQLERLALRIEISQVDEIARMRRWLERRGEEAPGGHAHGALMPGMLTAEQMASLAAARGAEFDRLFLELMIQHHEGALVMVRELHAGGAGPQEPELFQLVSHIDADQRAEIARMRGMLSTTPQGGSE